MSEPDRVNPTGKTKKEISKLIRLSAADYTAIMTKAEQAGLDFSKFVRQAALGQEVTEKLPPAIRKYVGSIANNLNQLTRLANAGKLSSASAEDLNKLTQAMASLIRKEACSRKPYLEKTLGERMNTGRASVLGVQTSKPS